MTAQIGDWVEFINGSTSHTLGVVVAIGVEEVCVKAAGAVMLVPASAIREVRRAEKPATKAPATK